MGECFKGWKRKTGVLTLVIACVFMGGWVRSLRLYDKVEFPADTHTTAFIVSTDQFVGGGILFDDASRSEWNFHEFSPEYTASDEYKGRNPLKYVRHNLEWMSLWYGFGIGGHSDESPYYWLIEWFIPYWSIVVPLTLISLWLLLSTPRKSTQKKFTEPTAEKVE